MNIRNVITAGRMAHKNLNYILWKMFYAFYLHVSLKLIYNFPIAYFFFIFLRGGGGEEKITNLNYITCNAFTDLNSGTKENVLIFIFLNCILETLPMPVWNLIVTVFYFKLK